MDKLWPRSARTSDDGELWLGGCAASALADEFGTPLYVFDEETLRTQARTYREALRAHYPGTAQAAYASKAYLCTAIAQLFAEEGLDLDVVSGGELYVALQAGFPPERIHFHGNNKSREELAEALAAGIGRIVVDNFHELETLGSAQHRLTFHESQFHVFPSGSACRRASQPTPMPTSRPARWTPSSASPSPRATPNERSAWRCRPQGWSLVGLHGHIGSQIYEPESLADAAAVLIAFAAQIRDRHGFVLRELSPGGGWGVPMTEDDPAAPVEPYIAAVSAAIVDTCRARGLALPHLVLEPGRSLVAPAAVALYTVGARRRSPACAPTSQWMAAWRITSGRRCMGRDMRPGSSSRSADQGHSAITIGHGNHEIVTIAGKFCESGDILIRDIELPRLEAGDLLAIPMAAAYTLRCRVTIIWRVARRSCWLMRRSQADPAP